MSPTSYLTAPPRSKLKEVIIQISPDEVNRRSRPLTDVTAGGERRWNGGR